MLRLNHVLKQAPFFSVPLQESQCQSCRPSPAAVFLQSSADCSKALLGTHCLPGWSQFQNLACARRIKEESIRLHAISFVQCNAYWNGPVLCYLGPKQLCAEPGGPLLAIEEEVGGRRWHRCALFASAPARTRPGKPERTCWLLLVLIFSAPWHNHNVRAPCNAHGLTTGAEETALAICISQVKVAPFLLACY